MTSDRPEDEELDESEGLTGLGPNEFDLMLSLACFLREQGNPEGD